MGKVKSKEINKDFMSAFDGVYRNRRVLVTGHTGFKGSWLCLLLNRLGADVYGYALEPPTTPSMYFEARVHEVVTSYLGDIRDLNYLQEVFSEVQPEIVIHMAAQPLVRDSYLMPVETYSVNVMGTVHVLEACRHTPSIRAVVNVTTDKCYENKEWFWGYRENESLGGYDPYSNSKGCSELATAAYRNSFFNPDMYAEHRVAIATARAGNVIGGGDWAADRLIPDFLRAISSGSVVNIRSPYAIRPWQHVLEPLNGYLTLGAQLFKDGSRFIGAWNFGPNDTDTLPVEEITSTLCLLWGNQATYQVDTNPQPHEASYLKLDCSKAKMVLGWSPRWDIHTALASVVEWHQAYLRKDDMQRITFSQMDKFFEMD